MQATLERLRERREQRGDEGGFTLIELLIVIVILGILAAIVVFAVQNLTGSSAKSSCGSDLKTVETAAEAYKAQLADYPHGAAVNTASWTLAPSTAAAPTGYGADWPNIQALLGTASSVSNPTDVIGPWLKDAPVNPGHYMIDLNSSGTVSVLNGAGTAVPTGCAGIS
jgi:prepilin-type N-terminal cleavage/methylation domain-containing protein